MRTVIYARYSSSLQNSSSITDQLTACRDRAAREGWTVVATFEDAAISGAAGTDDAQRPGLSALLDRVERGGIDQVLADSTSRIARDEVDAHMIRRRIVFAGARLFTLADGEIDDVKGWVKGFLDANQRRDMAHNIRRGQRGTVAQGRAPAGIAYGYRRANRIDDDGRFVRGLREIDEDQAAIVRRIFNEYADGESPDAIAGRLNREGVPAPQGAVWRSTTILGDRKRGNGMLNNHLYVGEIIVGRTRKDVNPVTRKTVIRVNPESEWTRQAAPALRIIDDALWQRVHARRAAGAGISFHAQRRPKRLLSGLVRCACCGGSYVIIGKDYWGCGRNRDGRSCDNGNTIRNDTLEHRVLAGLRRDLLHPDIVSAYVREWHERRAARHAAAGRERAQLQRRHDEADRKVKHLLGAIERGEDFDDIRELIARRRAERDALAEQLALIDAPAVFALHPGLDADYRRQVENLTQALGGDDPERRAASSAVRALIDRVELAPATAGRGVEISVFGRMERILNLAGGTSDALPSKARKRVR